MSGSLREFGIVAFWFNKNLLEFTSGLPFVEPLSALEYIQTQLYIYIALTPEKVFSKSAMVSGSTNQEVICLVKTDVI